jgi:hypothetical protein
VPGSGGGFSAVLCVGYQDFSLKKPTSSILLSQISPTNRLWCARRRAHKRAQRIHDAIPFHHGISGGTDASYSGMAGWEARRFILKADFFSTHWASFIHTIQYASRYVKIMERESETVVKSVNQ